MSIVEERKQVLTEREAAKAESKRLETELLESDVFKNWQASQGKIATSDNYLKKLNKQALGQLDIFSFKSDN